MRWMPDIAWLGARRRPRRLAVAATGVALSVAVMLLLAGIREGFNERVAALVTRTEADLWVSDPAVDSVTNFFSLIPQAAANTLRQHPDVAGVFGLYSVPVMGDLEGRKASLALLGYDLAGGVGGPWRMVAGRPPAAPGEVAVDAVFARQNGLRVGGQVELLGQPFRITGLSAETNSFMSSVVFADLAETGRLVGATGRISFVLVQIRPGADAERVRADLSRLVPDLTVRTQAEMAATVVASTGGTMEGPFRLLLGIAFIVGLMTTALMLYTAMLEQQGEYQALRAVGAPPALLVRVVLEEAAVVALAGAGLGLAVALLAARGLAAWAPEYTVALPAPVVGRITALVALLALAGALVPVRRVLRLDPAAALRG